MRIAIAPILAVALAAPAAAEPDENLMDLNQGLWTISDENGQGCDITLGDRPANAGARVIDDAGDCRNVVPALANVTAWRIDVPGRLVFLSDTDQPLVVLDYDRNEGDFKTVDHAPPLVMSPLD